MSDTEQNPTVPDTSVEAPKPTDSTAKPTADTAPAIDWEARAKQAEAEAEKWKTQSRKHEGRAKENADAAAQAKSVEQQLEDLRKQLTERDTKEAERAGREAVTRVYARLAESGFARKDVEGLLALINPSSLLVDGEPDDKAIDKLAESLVKVAGRATPDGDQGKKSSAAPADMNTLIRRAVGVVT